MIKITSPHGLTVGNHLDDENYYRQVFQGKHLTGTIIKGLYKMLQHRPASENSAIVRAGRRRFSPRLTVSQLAARRKAGSMTV